MRVFRQLSLLLAALSLFALLNQGVNLGLTEPMEVLLEWWEAFLQLMFGWAEPYLRALVLELFGVEITLYPHWRYLITLLALFFLADSQIAWSFFNVGQDLSVFNFYRIRAIIEPVLATVIALTAAVGLGALSPQSDMFGTLLVPVLGMSLLVHFLASAFWKAIYYRWIEEERVTFSTAFFREVFHLDFVFVLFITIFSAALNNAIQLGPFENIIHSSVWFSAFAFLLLLVVAYLVLGMLNTVSHRAKMRSSETREAFERESNADGIEWLERQIAESYWETFLHMYNSRIALAIIQVILGVALLVFANAGLRLLGL